VGAVVRDREHPLRLRLVQRGGEAVDCVAHLADGVFGLRRGRKNDLGGVGTADRFRQGFGVVKICDSDMAADGTQPTGLAFVSQDRPNRDARFAQFR
jgi:hypothetical protein